MYSLTHIVRPLVFALALGGAAIVNAQTVIQNNDPVTGISAPAGTYLHYKLWVPASKNQLEVKIAGSSGDADLYIRRGAVPTTTTWDFRPFLTGANEREIINNPAGTGGSWYFIMIRAFTSITNLTLTAQFQNVPRLDNNGGSVKNLASPERVYLHFHIDVPPGATKLIIKTSGGTGDMDMYVNHGTPADDNRWDFRPFNFGNNETVSVNNPASGTWWIMLDSFDAYTGLKLTAEFEGLAKYRMNGKGNSDKGNGVNMTDSPNTSWRYGNWGGAGWTNRRELKTGSWDGLFTAPPVDALDDAFRQHDAAIKNAAGNSAAKQQANQDLIDDLNALPGGANGSNHPVWGQIYVTSPAGAPASVTVQPGSPIALPQVIASPTPMPLSEYARRQAKLGVNGGWFAN